MPHLRVDKMVGNTRHDGREITIRDDRDFFDFLVMPSDELQVSKQRAEVLP